MFLPRHSHGRQNLGPTGPKPADERARRIREMREKLWKTRKGEIRVLVVDALPANVHLVGNILRKMGYGVLSATSGRVALETALAKHPDLILLDLLLPEIDGVDLCHELKAHPATRKIPVIFLTTANHDEDVTRAFNAGAVDFVTKPFNQAELKARVRAHIDLKLTHDQLEEVSREKSNLMHMAAHDLRNPLNIIQMNLDILMMSGGNSAKLSMHLTSMAQMVQRMHLLLKNVLSVQVIESGKQSLHLEIMEVGELLRRILSAQQLLAAKKEIVISVQLPAQKVELCIDPSAFAQIVENLLTNAIKFTPPGGRTGLELRSCSSGWELVVWDTGPGIHPEDEAKLFEKFAKLRNKPTAGEGSTGLGLSIVRQLADGMGGRIRYEPNPAGGSRFIVEFPSV